MEPLSCISTPLFLSLSFILLLIYALYALLDIRHEDSLPRFATIPRIQRASSKLHLQSYWSINGILIVSNRIVYPSKKERIDNNNKTKMKFGKLEIFLDSREKERVDNRVMG